VVHAFIHSRVDYCKAILVGVSDGVTRKLQSVLHAACLHGDRCPLRRAYHTNSTLRDTLHWLPWLPVRQRITYKIATMALRCVRGECPTYFTDVCIPVETVAGRAKLRSTRHRPADKNKYIWGLLGCSNCSGKSSISPSSE